MTFIKNGEPVYAEAINGAILMFETLNPQIIFYLPTDYSDGNFIATESKIGPCLVQIILDANTEIATNKLALKSTSTTGVITVRVYPNIEPFKEWNAMSWTDTKTTGTITCELVKDFGVTSVDASYTSGEYMGDKGLELEYVDFKFTLTKVGGNSPTLDTLTISFLGGT